jgi:hypothetical protein
MIEKIGISSINFHNLCNENPKQFEIQIHKYLQVVK